MKRYIRIGKSLVGEGKKTYIIAEAGFNHNGSLSIAKRMIKKAKDSGANAIKFQTFFAEEICNTKSAHYKIIKRGEFSLKDYLILRDAARKEGIDFISTPYGYKSADLLEKLNPAAYKIASMDLTNLPLLRYVAGKGKPVIVSTGMSEIKEIKEAIAAIKRAGNSNIIILHCISCYPTAAEQANLQYIPVLKKLLNLPVGYSDHTLGINTALAATCLGSCIIEKHFTIDKKLPGPDHKLSADPQELKTLIEAVREVEPAKNGNLDFKKRPDRKFGQAYRRSIFASCDIPKEAVITGDMLKCIRPGYGIPSKNIPLLIGRKARRFISKDSMLKMRDMK